LKRLVLFVCAAGLAACGGGIQIQTDYNPQQDFTGYHTYRWAERTPTGDDDPRVYNDIIKSRVQYAADSVLKTKGFERVDSGRAEFLMSWHGAINGKVSYNTVNTHYGYGWGGYYGGGWGGGMGSSRTYVNEWDEGTLIMHVIDAESNELVWMGSAQGKLNEPRSGEEARERDLDLLKRILGSFPPDQSN